MKEILSKLLPSFLVNKLQRIKLGFLLNQPYEKMAFALSDLPKDNPKSSYALKSEKESPAYQKTMRKMESFIAAGPVGPNKYWEYPWVLASLQLTPGLSILDAGCGRAPVQFALADLGMRVFAIDPNENVGWHGIDRRLAKKFNLDINYRVMGMEKIDYPDESFDRVISVSVIEHCRAIFPKHELKTPQTAEDRALQGRMMKELARVLKKGGLLVITLDLNFPVDGTLLESNVNVRNLIESSGLTLCTGDFESDGVYGDPQFNMQNLMNRPDLDAQNYTGVKGTSLGLVFRK